MSEFVERLTVEIFGRDLGIPEEHVVARRAARFVLAEMSSDVTVLAQAFSDETERQREQYGWQQWPKLPFDQWPENEKTATAAAFSSAFRAFAAEAGIDSDGPFTSVE